MIGSAISPLTRKTETLTGSINGRRLLYNGKLPTLGLLAACQHHHRLGPAIKQLRDVLVEMPSDDLDLLEHSALGLIPSLHNRDSSRLWRSLA